MTEFASGLLEGTREFHRRTAPLVRPLLQSMASKQTPSPLFITCADSRIVPDIITASGPGDLFTTRNIGNFVPPASSTPSDESVAATIEYAVKVLRVRTITVCGHSECGAMAALLGEIPELPALRKWLHNGRHSVARFRTSPALPLSDDSSPSPLDADAKASLDRLCRINVMQQLDNLRTYPMVERLVQAGDLELTGLYFDIGAARVEILHQGGFTPVDSLHADALTAHV